MAVGIPDYMPVILTYLDGQGQYRIAQYSPLCEGQNYNYSIGQFTSQINSNVPGSGGYLATNINIGPNNYNIYDGSLSNS